MDRERYSPADFESEWQRRWREQGLFAAREDDDRPRTYVLEMFPYPSGHMHMGHVRVYAIGDVLVRFLRMQGQNVLHPMGFDAFGLPAENAAIEEGIHPSVRTRENISSFRSQMEALGYAFDWDRCFATCDPHYYRWNQWFFLRMMEKGLAYRRTAKLNWCPSCATVLANEQVEDGLCWRCGTAVSEREMPQWALRITAYAQELLDDLEKLEAWPDAIVTMQRNWIGRSEGVEVAFPVEGDGEHEPIQVFTTRGDTIFGATYLVLAPEHPLTPRVTTSDRQSEVEDFASRVAATDPAVRTSPDSEKQGVFTGAYATNPFTRERIPIWVGNFVLSEYGTGAIMSVPAHDERDFRFARKYEIPIKVVVQPSVGENLSPNTMEEAFTGDGVLDESGPYTGMTSAEAREAIGAFVEEEGIGVRTVNWHLRDWGISRQRYWGTPIPVIHCERDGLVPVPDEDLPVELPQDVPFTGTGGSPLEQAEEWADVECPMCGGRARRETETMDTFVDSSWYYARYCDAANEQLPVDKEKADRWLPVDIYVGGPEHAVMHLLYFRFWHKVMRDLGLLSSDEPVRRLVTQGIVMKGGAKMSKSLGNTVSPAQMIEKYGADTVRMFILFAAPPDKDIDWNDEAVEGLYRFLARVWRLIAGRLEEVRGIAPAESVESLGGDAKNVWRTIHQAVEAVTRDIGERLMLNTAIARIMELTTALVGFKPADDAERSVLRLGFETLLFLLHPYAPHLTEELWSEMGGEGFLIGHAWPRHDPEALIADTMTLVVQVNGKLRGSVEVPIDAGKDAALEAARSEPNVARFLEGKSIRKEIFVPGRLVNFVAN